MNIPSNNKKYHESKGTVLNNKKKFSGVACTMVRKKCARKQCKNLIWARDKMKYCIDPECLAKRDIKKQNRERAREYRKNNVVYSPDINLEISRGPQDIGKIIVLQCTAKGEQRCTDTYKITYHLNTKWYPKFCKRHRNHYQRQRFEEGKIN